MPGDYTSSFSFGSGVVSHRQVPHTPPTHPRRPGFYFIFPVCVSSNVEGASHRYVRTLYLDAIFVIFLPVYNERDNFYSPVHVHVHHNLFNPLSTGGRIGVVRRPGGVLV